tara:strand:+ start:3072 stop:3215 length:144 start_codon:yes stop_codon:yes gene_type:complete
MSYNFDPPSEPPTTCEHGLDEFYDCEECDSEAVDERYDAWREARDEI